MTRDEQQRALELMGGSLTKGGIDRARAVLTIRAGGRDGLRIVLDARRRWLDYLSVGQRQWQSGGEHGARTRNAERRRLLHGAWAKDHPRLEAAITEHLATRERYVRCSP